MLLVTFGLSWHCHDRWSVAPQFVHGGSCEIFASRNILDNQWLMQLLKWSHENISVQNEWMCLQCRPLWECHWASPAPLAASGAAGWSLLAAARKKHFENKYCNRNYAKKCIARYMSAHTTHINQSSFGKYSHRSLVEWSPWSLQLLSALWWARHPTIS